MITKNTALVSCITMLQELMSGASNDVADTIDACLQDAQIALEIPDFPGDFEFEIEGPDGINLHPEPYPDLQSAMEAAAAFPLRFVQQGCYSSVKYGHIELELLPKCLTLTGHPKEVEVTA